MAEPPREILIDPVSRVEGHARISIIFDAHGRVRDARLHVTEYRGFEHFCRGRLVWEMPRLTSRICGVCPVSHSVTSAKAGDDILAVAIPRTAENLRRILVLAQWVQSHTLSFFHLSSPDLLLGKDIPAAQRDFFTVMKTHADFARRGIRLRKWGQEVIARIAGRRIHPDFITPGGVLRPLSVQDRDILLDGLPGAHNTVRLALETVKALLESGTDDRDMFGNFPSLFLGLVDDDGGMEYYGGALRVMDAAGNVVADRVDPRSYRDFIAERSEPWSYMTFPHYSPSGVEGGLYRVGPLARCNISSHTGSPKSDRELAEFRQRAGSRSPVLHSFAYHLARCIEILFALERIEELLTDPETLRTDTLRARAFSNRPQGIGVTEAPRGTLFHNYTAGSDGVIRHVDFLIATAQNNAAMNRTIQQIAMHQIRDAGKDVDAGILQRIEAGIRCYDPCFSCATHALGKMPLLIEYRNEDDSLIRSFRR